MKISDKKKKSIFMLREEGLSYEKIAKQTKVSRSSVVNILKKELTKEPQPLDAWVYKICPNPRVIFIHFGSKERWSKCVVKAGLFNAPGKPLKVMKVETSDEELYRQV